MKKRRARMKKRAGMEREQDGKREWGWKKRD